MKPCKILISAGALFAGLPGLTALTASLVTPPDSEALFAAAATIVGVLAVLLSWVFRSRLAQFGERGITVVTAVSAFVFLCSLGFYIVSLQKCTLAFEYAGDQRTQFVPLFLDKEIQAALDGGTLKAFASEYGPDELKSIVSDSALGMTRFTLLVSYMLLTVGIVWAFCAPAQWLADNRAEQ